MIIVSFDHQVFCGYVLYFGAMPIRWSAHLKMLSMMAMHEAVCYAQQRGWELEVLR